MRAETRQIGTRTVDSSAAVSNRWHSVRFRTNEAGRHALSLDWDNTEANLSFSLFAFDGTNRRFITRVSSAAKPEQWSGQLEANTDYFLGVWAISGAARFTATLTTMDAPTEPDQFLLSSDVIDYGTADKSARLGRAHNVVQFWAKESGPVTIELEWEGSEQMNLAVFDQNTNQKLGERVGPAGSPKRITLDLRVGRQYRATAWVNSGTAAWVMRRIQQVPNPDVNISSAADNADRPNIVLINTDDQRADTIRFLPAIRELLMETGTTYPNAIVPTPSCCPSRATTLSGQYVHNNGQFQQQRQNEQIFERTFQKYLKEAGYFTGHSGKYLHWLDKEDDIAPYWDRWTYISGGFYDVDMNFDGRYGKPGGYTTDIIFERAKEYLRDFEARNDSTPWFVYVAPLSPHSPSTPEYEFRNVRVPVNPGRQNPAYSEEDISDKPDFFRFRSITGAEVDELHQLRMRNLLSVDKEVRELVDYLEASGELDNTLIIFTSDNGFLLGEHQTREKFLPYRDSVQIPFVVSWPGNVPANVVNDAFVSHVDIAPTILEAAGISTRGLSLDGRNMFDESRDTFFMEYFFDPAANGGRIDSWASIRNDEYQYTEWYDQDDENQVVFREYYDMVTDPFQLENLYENGRPGDDPDYSRLSDELQSARQCSGDSCP